MRIFFVVNLILFTFQLVERMEAWSKDYESNDSDKSQRIGDIFMKIGPFLLMYTEYIKEFDKSNNLINDTYAKNPKFKAVMDEIQVSYVADKYWNILLTYLKI